jgi:catechol 2,3-dioxygenase-like lactoylglutathione lyase family enzyme
LRDGVRVAHVILSVSDLETARVFYADVLGLPQHGESGAFVFFDAGSVVLAIRPGPAAASPATEIVFAVDDVDAAYRSLRERGIQFRTEPRPVMNDGERDLVAVDFTDPDGHVLSITGWVERE